MDAPNVPQVKRAECTRRAVSGCAPVCSRSSGATVNTRKLEHGSRLIRAGIRIPFNIWGLGTGTRMFQFFVVCCRLSGWFVGALGSRVRRRLMQARTQISNSQRNQTKP